MAPKIIFMGNKKKLEYEVLDVREKKLNGDIFNSIAKLTLPKI